MNVGRKMREAGLTPGIFIVMVLAFLLSVFATMSFMQYANDEPEFNRTEIVENGTQVAVNSTHRVYAKCVQDYSAQDINISTINQSWVQDNCWSVAVKREDNEEADGGLTLG